MHVTHETKEAIERKKSILEDTVKECGRRNMREEGN